MRWGLFVVLAAVLGGCDEANRLDEGASGARGDRPDEVQTVAAASAGQSEAVDDAATDAQEVDNSVPRPRYHIGNVVEALPGEVRDNFPGAHPVVDPMIGSAAPGLLGDENTAAVAGHVTDFSCPIPGLVK